MATSLDTTTPKVEALRNRCTELLWNCAVLAEVPPHNIRNLHHDCQDTLPKIIPRKRIPVKERKAATPLVLLRDLAEAVRLKYCEPEQPDNGCPRPSSASSVNSVASHRRPSSSFFRSFPSMVGATTQHITLSSCNENNTTNSNSTQTNNSRAAAAQSMALFLSLSHDLEDLAQCSASNTFETALCRSQIKKRYAQLPIGVCFCFRCGSGPFSREKSETACSECQTVLHYGSDSYSDTTVVQEFNRHAERRRLIIVEEKVALLRRLSAAMKKFQRGGARNEIGQEDVRATTPKGDHAPMTHSNSNGCAIQPSLREPPRTPTLTLPDPRPHRSSNAMVSHPRAPSQRTTALRARLSALERQPNPIFRLQAEDDVTLLQQRPTLSQLGVLQSRTSIKAVFGKSVPLQRDK